jgi:hypothetical protein
LFIDGAAAEAKYSTRNRRGGRLAGTIFMAPAMCDLERQRIRIEAILAETFDQERAHGVVSEKDLLNLGMEALRLHYESECPDECIRTKCEQYVASFLSVRRPGRDRARCERDHTSQRRGA